MYLIDFKNYQLQQVIRYEPEDVSRHGSPFYRYWCTLTNGSVVDSMTEPLSYPKAAKALKRHLSSKINMIETDIKKMSVEKQLLKNKLMSLEEEV